MRRLWSSQTRRGKLSRSTSGDVRLQLPSLRLLALALCAIAILLWLALHRIRDVLVTLIPLLVAGTATLEICGLTGFSLDYSNIIALPALLGVGVAFKIYYVMAWRGGEANFLQSSLTRAVFFSALMTATAFGSFWFSGHPAFSSMGKLLAFSLACTLASAALFQPDPWARRKIKAEAPLSELNTYLRGAFGIAHAATGQRPVALVGGGEAQARADHVTVVQAARATHNPIKWPGRPPRCGKPMRCMACGGEMVLISALEDLTKPVLGFERETYICSGCGDPEQRTVFTSRPRKGTTPNSRKSGDPPRFLPRISLHSILSTLAAATVRLIRPPGLPARFPA